MDKTERIKDLIKTLNEASVSYYKYDNPTMTDKQYDDLYDELSDLEKETGIIMSNSPTQKVQGETIEYLEKVQHGKPMLSADKTKDISKIKKFIGDRFCVMSWKEDGLTIVLRYKDGVLDKAITRGKDGLIGEDVTHTMRMCKNIPLKIPYCIDIEVRGECVISWDDFYKINDNSEETKTHPRNLAAGSVRQLNASIAKDRNIKYKAFELVQDYTYEKSKSDPSLLDHIFNISESFNYLSECGFDVVEHDFVTQDNVEEMIKKYNPENYEFPVDGLIFEYNDYLYGKSLGETGHHPLNMIAMKWEDELYETTLRDIEWNTSKSGLINPVAVFDETVIDGAGITRATLHNISYIENLQLGIGDKIQIYKANKIIPKVHDNLTRSNTWKLPNKCPNCGGNVEVHNENGSKTLHCINDNCSAKLLGKLVHFCSKNAINIEGKSEATLQFLIDKGWIKSFKDIYKLDYHRENWKEYDGFGDKSVDKLLDAVENSRKTTFDRFIYSLSIPQIGRSASKDIAKYCNNSIDEFTFIMENTSLEFAAIDGIGVSATTSLDDWWNTNRDMFYELAEEFIFATNKKENNNVLVDLSGKIFVITGSLIHYKNRDELVGVIEGLNGKVSGSVSAKTSYLINNDTQSSSSKNQKAKQLNIPIISEEDFINMIS